MAINKNFVVKNGIEVNTNLIVADTDSNKVGIGTTVPEYTLHVFQGTGIGATTINVTGVGTFLEELNVGLAGTTLTAISNVNAGIAGSVGVGTDAPGYLLEVHSPVTTGQTALYVRGDAEITGDINLTNLSISQLNVTGLSTFADDIFIGTGATVGFGSTAFFKDYAKAIFGDGEDLKIYHDSSNSYISDSGTGGLIVGSNSLTIKNGALNETQAVFTENGAVELYYDNTKRLETTVTGVDVTGNFRSTGITTLASSGGITTTGGDLYVGGDLFINEDIVLDTNLEILGIATVGSIHVTGISTFDGELRGPNLTNSVVVGTGLSVRGSATGVAVTLAAAGGITTTGGDLYVGGDLYINEDIILDTNLTILGIATIGSLNLSNTSGINTIDSTVQSSSKDTGSLVLQGGLGIEKQLYVGAGASVGAGLTVKGNLLPEADGTRDLGASGTEWKDLYIDGTANIDSLSADTAAIGDLTNNRVVIAGASGELEDSADLTFDGDTLAVNAIFDSNDATQSSSSTTGSAQFAGGVGIAKNLFVGGGAEITGLTTITGVLNANNTLQSTSPINGALATLGGLAVVKNAYIGGGQVTVGIHTITDLRVGTQLAGQSLVGITTILDEDNMASNSAAALATQQSIKAYVDATTTASDLDFQGDSGGAQSVDLDSQTFTIAGTTNEIETSSSGQTLTVGLPNDVTIGGELDVTTLDVSGNADIDGHTELDNVNVAGFSTFVSNVIIGTGATVGFGSTAFFRDDAKAIFGDGDDLQIYHDGSNSYIDDAGDGNLVIRSNQINFNKYTGEALARFRSDADVELYYDNVSRFKTGPAGTITVGVGTFDGLSLGDNEKALFGAGDDLQIYHAGSHTHIREIGAGALKIEGANINIDNADGSKRYIDCNDGGSVELYHDNSIRFETTADGADFSGTGSIKVPVGTTAQRPSGVAGDFRYNTTTGNFEGYTDEWGAIAGGGGGSETDTSVSSTSATSIYTTPHATNRSVSAVIQITQGSAYQVGRYLVIHNGTTATIVEESAIATGDMLGSFTADINGSNLRILANMSSASSATVTILPTVVTV